jgi:hypothetical protein
MRVRTGGRISNWPRKASGSSSPKNSLNSRSRLLIAAFGASIYALYGLRILSTSIPSVLVFTRDYATGSGGLGAVTGVIDLIFLSYVLLAMASIVANRMLAAWARGSGRNIKVLHQTQRWSIVLAFVVLIASVVGFNVGGGPLPFVLLPLGGVVWGVHFVLTSVLLGAYAVRPSRT